MPKLSFAMTPTPAMSAGFTRRLPDSGNPWPVLAHGRHLHSRMANYSLSERQD